MVGRAGQSSAVAPGGRTQVPLVQADARRCCQPTRSDSPRRPGVFHFLPCHHSQRGPISYQLVTMEYQCESNGWRTFWENFWLPVIALTAIVASLVLTFFSNLSDQPWIDLFIATMALLVSGAVLILYAKLPAYLSGRFFTFGLKSVPKRLAGFYRWGWCVFLSGVTLSLLLSLSHPH